MSEFQDWRLTHHDRIAFLTLNRPEHSNSLRPETFIELGRISASLAEEKGIWAVIIQGKGDHFSTGMDIEVIQQMINLEEARYRQALLEMQLSLDAFEALPMPTIAKLHGFCLGGGVILALCCDFRIAAQRTVIGFPEVKRGLPILMGTHRVTRLIGPARTRDLLYFGRNLRAHTAQSYGLLQEVVPAEELDQAALALANKFLRLPPRTIAAIKHILIQGHHLSLRASQDLEIDTQAELLRSPDFEEAVRSFLENRPPTFTGL
jgi:enoyl-CoA hydratase